jgi:hypothetical protein
MRWGGASLSCFCRGARSHATRGTSCRTKLPRHALDSPEKQRPAHAVAPQASGGGGFLRHFRRSNAEMWVVIASPGSLQNERFAGGREAHRVTLLQTTLSPCGLRPFDDRCETSGVDAPGASLQHQNLARALILPQQTFWFSSPRTPTIATSINNASFALVAEITYFDRGRA